MVIGRHVALCLSLTAIGCSGTLDDAASDDAADDADGEADALDEGGVVDARTDAADATADSREDARDAAIDTRPEDTAPPVDARPPEKDIDSIPWQTGASIGYGVASKDTENPVGDSAVIAYAGYNVSLSSAEAWVTALYRASLHDRGVRHVWAVRGPADPTYTGKEIGNSKIIAALLPKVTASTKFILVVGHSSGSFVAHELLGQLAGGLDPSGATDKRVVYFDLDGGTTGLDAAIVGRLRNAYFVGSYDGAVATYSPNAPDMRSGGATYAAAGGYYQNDASASGCNAGAQWCVHVTLVTTRPHDPTNADPLRDYSDFVGRSVAHAYLDAKGGASGLVP